MKPAVKGLALLVGALLLQILISHRMPTIQRSVDLVLLLVVYYGSSGSRMGAMLVGAAGGLLEDVWFGHLNGLHGFTKMLIGYLLGGLGARFDLSGPGARLIAVLLATLIERGTEPIVLIVLGMPATAPSAADLAWRCVGNVSVAALVFLALAGPGRITKRASRRRFALS